MTAEQMPKTQLFGTIFKPNMRWVCGACGTNNVSHLGIPLRPVERVSCKRCHRMKAMPLDISKVPREWGGHADLKPDYSKGGKPP